MAQCIEEFEPMYRRVVICIILTLLTIATPFGPFTMATSVRASGSTPGPIWSQGHYFPKFPAVRNLFVLDLSQQLDDPIVLTLLSLQGIVNRNSPQIYLILDQYSSFWLQYTKTTIPTLQITQLNSSTDLISRFTSEIKGLVVYDPSVPDTINVATTIAGLQDRLIVAPSSLTLIQQILGSVNVLDLRSDVSSLGWSNSPSGRLQLYQWVYDNLWPQCDKRMIGVANPGVPVSSYSVSLGIRDYIVALGLVTLYLSPTDPNQAALYAKFLSTAPSPIPIFGWTENDEDNTVSLVSSYGDWVAVLSHVNNPSYPADLTVLSGLPIQPVRYTPQVNANSTSQASAPGVYVTAYVTDGDNLGYDYSLGFGQWDAYRTSGVPVGWTINPTLVDIAPLVWNYYVATKGLATFVAGPSGAGYAQPGMMSTSQLNDYLNYAQGYWQTTGLATAQVLGDTTSHGVDWGNGIDQAAQLYENNLGPLGLFNGYYSTLEPNMLPYALGTPSEVFFQHVSGVTVAPNAYAVADDARDWNEAQVMANLIELAQGKAPSDPVSYAAANLPGFGEVVSDPTSMSGQVRVGHSSETYTGSIVYGPYVTLPAGNYRVTFRLKSSNVKTQGPLAVLDAIKCVPHGADNTFAQKQIATTDLPTNSWQQISLTFNLTAITDNIEFRVTFLPGSSDLYVDTINVSKLDGWSVSSTNQPVFVALSLKTTSDPNERAGFLQHLASLDPRVHLLNTDEFFAAVNAYYSQPTSSQSLITRVDSGQGSISPTCPSGCTETVGQSVNVAATPSSGWLFSGWSTQNGQSCSSNPCTFNMPNNQVTLTANFTQNMPTLTTNAASGSGSVSPNCPTGCQQQVGSSVSVSANATSGWTFSSWTVTGASCSGGSSSNPCTFTMPNNDVTLSATFTQITVSSTTTSVSSSTMTTLSSTTNSTVSSTTSSVSSSTTQVSAQIFTAVDSGQGSVTPNCPSGCSETVGSQVTVTANPASGWLFSGWSTQNGQSCSSNPCTFNMPNNQVTLKATFTQTTQTLTTNVGSGSGTVTPNCPSGCSEAVASLISISATPASGWSFSSWSTSGASCSGGSSINPCALTMPNNPVTVSATFTQVTQILITGVDAGSGSISSNCPSGCSESVGSSITVQATPSSGWQFSNWSTQSGISCSSNPCTFNMPNQQVTLKASFTQNPPSTQTLTTSVASGQGTVNPNCPAPSGCQETVGQTITVTGTASSGWQFYSWSVISASCSGGSSSNPCQFTMPNSGVSVSATFTQTPPNAQSLSTGVDSGQGTISPNCQSGCSEAVGSSVTVAATPSSGWQFSNWSTQIGMSCSTNPCTFTMPNNALTLAATFTQVTQTLTTNVASGSGSVSPNCPGPNGCSTAVNSSISVQATPASGWQFSTWNVTGASCSGGASSNPCTFSMPENPATVSATFTDPQTLITSVDAGSGSVLPNCPSGCSEAVDSSITVTATPGSGWQFSSWSTQIGISCSSNPCTFSMPDNAVTLRAMFTQLFDFRLANSGTSSNLGGIAVQHGSSGTISISVTLISGAPQTVSLSCAEANGNQLPTGVSCSFNPASNSPDFSSTLTVSTNSSAPIGYYTIRVIGTGGGLTRVTIFTLCVT